MRAHGSYEALLEDPEVDAIYLATPHPQHAEWLVRAARAGKHVLCEKPLCVNAADAEAALAEAAAAGVTVREAFMYRCHPQTAALAEAVRGGRIGDLKLIEAVFSFDIGAEDDRAADGERRGRRRHPRRRLLHDEPRPLPCRGNAGFGLRGAETALRPGLPR